MTTGGDSLTVTIAGKDVGLEAVLKKVDAEMAKSADQAVKLGQSYARLAQAQGQPVAASKILAGTIGQAGAASEKALIGIETQAARLATSGGGIAQFGASAASSLTSFLGPAALATAAIGGLIAVGKSFGDAFKFKADLDATTLAVNAQIKGIRESGQVWSQAAGFANEFKLTQEETTKAVQASIGVMRSSKASVEDILGVLARMQVLSPEQSLEEAAIALKSLAAGDTTSLVTRFEVSRDLANQMKQEIQGGADAVAVMSKFLGDTGIGMDVLKTKTEGASGAMKDLAVAQEQLQLAQAQFAQGPGLELLRIQTSAVSAATRILSGDLKATAQEATASAAAQQAFTAAMRDGAGIAGANAAAQEAYKASIEGATEATLISTGAMVAAADGTRQHTAAISEEAQALVDETQKKLESAQSAQQLAAFQETLASLGGAVAGGLMTAGNAAAQLASQYNIATSAAEALINAQARLAQAKVNAAALVEQRAGERMPGASGVNEAAAQEQARLNAIYKKLVIPEPKAKKAKKGGGGGTPGISNVKLTDQAKLQNSLIASQETYQQKSEDAEGAHLDRLLTINQDFADKMLKAQQDFGMAQVEGRASFYDTLGGIEDAGLRQALSAQYEAAFAEADKIAAERGADVGQKFLEARQAAIQAQGQRASEIAQATKDGDKDKAEYLAGVDKLYRDAEQRKLDAITSGQDSVSAQRDQALADEGAKYADAQAKIGDSADTAAQRKILASQRAGKQIDVEKLGVDSLKASYDALGVAGSRAGVTPATAPTTPPVGTPATTATAAAAPAADPMIAALDAIRAAVDAAANAIVGAEKDTGSAVRGLSGKFAS